jgi:hypothetical protein
MSDDANVLAADKRRAVTRLQELEDDQRIDAVQAREGSTARLVALGKADAFALARDVVEGRWF